jgi:hypothetical protein
MAAAGWTSVGAVTDCQLVRRALCDAINWQESLASAYFKGAPEHTEATDLARSYRRLMKKRYGESRLPMEIATEGMESISIQELSRRRSGS